MTQILLICTDKNCEHQPYLCHQRSKKITSFLKK